MKYKIYLDANIIYGYFLAKYRELKKKERFAEPKVIEFLRGNKEKIVEGTKIKKRVTNLEHLIIAKL